MSTWTLVSHNLNLVWQVVVDIGSRAEYVLREHTVLGCCQLLWPDHSLKQEQPTGS